MGKRITTGVANFLYGTASRVITPTRSSLLIPHPIVLLRKYARRASSGSMRGRFCAFSGSFGVSRHRRLQQFAPEATHRSRIRVDISPRIPLSTVPDGFLCPLAECGGALRRRSARLLNPLGGASPPSAPRRRSSRVLAAMSASP